MKMENKTNEPHYFSQPEENDKRNVCSILRRINHILIQAFYNFGYKVGSRPAYFIIIPFILSVFLSTGFFFIEYVENPIILFVPFDAPFIREQNIVESHFWRNYSELYDPVRITRHEGYSRVIVSAKDEQSIFRSSLWPEIMSLDETIRNISAVSKNGTEMNYEALCAKWRGHCTPNYALNINEIVGGIENGTEFINYPVMIFPFIIPHLLGGIEVNKSAGRIDDAKAIVLAYFIRTDNEELSQMANNWEKNLIDYLKEAVFEKIEVSFFASRSLGDELKVKMDSCIPYIPLTGFIMVTACMGLLWMSDCVRGKPLIGVVGIISAIMATGASFGFLIYCRTIYTRLNVVALFLVLGIGVDDIFVAISAWQKTSIKDSVPKRLAQTYADAAVSVTITSLTNALAFGVGISTPTLIVRAFCLYSCVTILFAYAWFITFCGGFLALSGYMEEQARHSLFIVKIKEAPKDISRLKKKFYSLICASATHGINTEKREDMRSHVVSMFFRDHVGSLLCNKTFRIGAFISLIIYLSGAIYGLTVLKEGLYRHRMARDDSYLADFFRKDAMYFRHLPYSVQLVITGNITYSDPETQEKLLSLEKKFENHRYASNPIYTQSWLRSFLHRLKRKKEWQKNVLDEASFIKVLREKFLNANPDNRLALDVEFNDDYSRILASRMLFQAADVKDVYEDVEMMHLYRKLAAQSEFNATVYHLLFSLFDQHSMMRPLTLQSLMIAVLTVMFVALLFIPDVRGSFALAFSILSIATGVIGYMAFWDINLDHVSAGSIFMCIGFSVDFSAHITYTYLSSTAKTTEGKIRQSMHNLGLPILQGGFTTVLCLVTFLLIPGYGYKTFFKTIFLVTIFAAYHSIILIPLFLAQLEDIKKIYHKKNSLDLNPVNESRHCNGSSKHLPNDRTTNQNNNETKTSIKERNGNGVHCISNGNLHKTQPFYERYRKIDEERGLENKAFSPDEA